MLNSKFITIEGPDGAGKTTLLNKILPILQEKYGDDLVSTREPGGNRVAEAIRGVVLDHPEFTEMDDRTEALLFAAARRQHIVETILPALEAGKIVISDRYVDSSVTYQGGGRQIGTKAVYDMNLFATDGLMPSLTLYVDIPSEVGIQRIMKSRTDEVNRLDVDALEFHKKVRDAYLELAEQNPDRIKTLDGQKSVEELVDESIELIYKHLEETK